jgi:peptidoglycan/xylan/chitin deacetylase (PgdA/CDA1 family)
MLMYHAVTRGKQTPDWPWAVSEISFCRQLDFLSAEGYQTVTMGDLAASLVKPTGRTVVITFDDGYVNNLTACDELIKRNMRASWFIVSGSLGRRPAWPADGRPDGRMLTPAELRRMHEAGMEIGSHTVSHARMPELDDPSLRRELMDSKTALEDVIGATVSSFAYPYGAWDERCAEAVKGAGYSAACTTRTGWTMRDCDPYRLRRLTVFNHDSLGSFARKLYFGSHDVAWSDMARYALRHVGLMR